MIFKCWNTVCWCVEVSGRMFSWRISGCYLGATGLLGEESRGRICVAFVGICSHNKDLEGDTCVYIKEAPQHGVAASSSSVSWCVGWRQSREPCFVRGNIPFLSGERTSRQCVWWVQACWSTAGCTLVLYSVRVCRAQTARSVVENKPRPHHPIIPPVIIHSGWHLSFSHKHPFSLENVALYPSTVAVIYHADFLDCHTSSQKAAPAWTQTRSIRRSLKTFLHICFSGIGITFHTSPNPFKQSCYPSPHWTVSRVELVATTSCFLWESLLVKSERTAVSHRVCMLVLSDVLHRQHR